MTSIAKLKDRARKHEQKEDWKAAIEAYQKVLEAEQTESELELELGLFNRVGDLYLRLGQTDEAVAYYEQAADKYADAGFFNNAIALCNKALRHRPERAQIYLKLSRLCAEQGFVTDARRWILDYAERQVRTGRIDSALDGLTDFVERSVDPDVREFLAEQLATHGRGGEAASQFALAYAERMERGETDAAQRAGDRARELDPGIDLDAVASTRAKTRPDDETPEAGSGTDRGSGAGGVSDDGSVAGLEIRPDGAGDDAPEVAGVEGLESAGGAPAGVEDEVEGTELAGLEASYSGRAPEPGPADAPEADALGGLETFGTVDLDDEDDAAPEPEAAAEAPADAPADSPVEAPGAGLDGPDDLDLPDEEEEDVEPLPMLDVDYSEDDALDDDLDDEDAEPLPMMTFDDGEPEPALGTAESSEDSFGLDLDLESDAPGEAAAETPPEAPREEPAATEPPSVVERARALVAQGSAEEALAELSRLSGAEEDEATLRDALSVVNEIVRGEANNVPALQRRVELATRLDDRELMVGAYLDLADTLVRLGSETKAEAMYERVLGLDPENAAAQEALGPVEEEEDEEPMDLGAVLGDAGDEAVAAADGPFPDDASDPEFAAMLSQFKARVTENSGMEDAGDHYDLGLAFKEMGLIDEAIAEFQTALTGGEERLKVYEELGQCFVLKNQYNVALKIFSRALQVPHQDPAELLGVYYHMGQCHEELGDRERAKDAYEKVLAIDPSFQDVPDRMARL